MGLSKRFNIKLKLLMIDIIFCLIIEYLTMAQIIVFIRQYLHLIKI